MEIIVPANEPTIQIIKVVCMMSLPDSIKPEFI